MITETDAWAKSLLIRSIQRQLEKEVQSLEQLTASVSPTAADLIRKAYRQSSSLSATLNELNQSLQGGNL